MVTNRNKVRISFQNFNLFKGEEDIMKIACLRCVRRDLEAKIEKSCEIIFALDFELQFYLSSDNCVRQSFSEAVWHISQQKLPTNQIF